MTSSQHQYIQRTEQNGQTENNQDLNPAVNDLTAKLTNQFLQ